MDNQHMTVFSETLAALFLFAGLFIGAIVTLAHRKALLNWFLLRHWKSMVATDARKEKALAALSPTARLLYLEIEKRDDGSAPYYLRSTIEEYTDEYATALERAAMRYARARLQERALKHKVMKRSVHGWDEPEDFSSVGPAPSRLGQGLCQNSLYASQDETAKQVAQKQLNHYLEQYNIFKK